MIGDANLQQDVDHCQVMRLWSSLVFRALGLSDVKDRLTKQVLVVWDVCVNLNEADHITPYTSISRRAPDTSSGMDLLHSVNVPVLNRMKCRCVIRETRWSGSVEQRWDDECWKKRTLCELLRFTSRRLFFSACTPYICYCDMYGVLSTATGKRYSAVLVCGRPWHSRLSYK